MDMSNFYCLLWWDYAPDPLNPDVLTSDWLFVHNAAFSLVTDPVISSLQPRSPPLSSSCLILSKAEYRDEELSWVWVILWLIMSWKGLLGITLLLFSWGCLEADVRGWGKPGVTSLSSNETQCFWLMFNVTGWVLMINWVLRREASGFIVAALAGAARHSSSGKPQPKSGAETRKCVFMISKTCGKSDFSFTFVLLWNHSKKPL